MIANTILALLSPVPSAVVTGGTLVTSGGFNYRVFTGNGTLGVTGASLTCDILIIAGGGGGGASNNSGPIEA